jgi:putative ABC transport system permease protein
MLSDLLYRLKALFRGRALDRELDDELRFHLEHQAAAGERAGLSPGEARRQAQLAFGGVDRAKEGSRDGRGVRVLEVAWRDLRYAGRTLARSPIFTLVAVLSLTLGVGANTAMFQLLNALVLRTLPVVNPQELVEVRLSAQDMRTSGNNISRYPAVSYPVWEHIREQQEAFDPVFAWADERFDLSPSGEMRRVPGLWVSGEYFPALGLVPALGRLFTGADDRPGCGQPGAVVSHDFWERELGGDRQAPGRTLTVNGARVEVIGVSPAGFTGLQVGQGFDVALLFCSIPTMQPGSTRLTRADNSWVTPMGRLRAGWTIERAGAQLQAISPGIFAATLPPDHATEYVKTYLAATLLAQPAGTGLSSLRETYSTPLTLLLAMTGFVLLIACANLTNLMLARGAVRRRELSLRLALGASRGRLVSQLLCESIVIAGLSALAGALVARLLGQALVRLMDVRVLSLTADWRVAAFMGGTALVVCLLLGLMPALRASRGEPGDVLKSGTRGVGADRESLMLRRVLVVAQVAVSLVLVVGALLFARSFRNLITEPLGFEPRRVFIVDASVAPPTPPPETLVTMKREMIVGLRGIAGVEAAAESFVLPLSGNNSSGMVWPDAATRAQGREASFNRVSSGYFETLGMRLLAGRDIRDSDTATAPRVAVVNETFARQFVPGGNPVGQRFWHGGAGSRPDQSYEIVGLVADAKYRRLRDTPMPVAFVALVQRGGNSEGGVYVVRTAASLQAFTPTLREAVARVHPNLRFVVRSFEDEVDGVLRRDRVMALLSSLFGLLAALLAAVGLHGVVSYAVERRRRELGIRLALGASRGAVIASVLRESGLLVGAGLALGVVCSLLLTGAARTLLFGLDPRDAATIATAVSGLALVALTASLLPAQRAARVDPMATLKEE